jgi:hypothetical protein
MSEVGNTAEEASMLLTAFGQEPPATTGGFRAVRFAYTQRRGPEVCFLFIGLG